MTTRVIAAFMLTSMLILSSATAQTPSVATASGRIIEIAQTSPSGDIKGLIVSQVNGLSIVGADVTLRHGQAVIAETKSDARGRYQFLNQPPGIYRVEVNATGYSQTSVNNVSVASGSTTSIATPILVAETNGAPLQEIAFVKSKAIGNTLASTTTIQTNLNPVALQQQGFLNGVYAIGRVPGVNISGGPHTVGDDVSIDIRGMGAGEVLPLIDGHPVGPMGVFSTDYYDWVNSPFSLLRNIQVTEGSGATGLYGVDVIGGTIDLQTLESSSTPQFAFTQMAGSQGDLSTLLKATGRIGKLAYALGHAVTGTYADFTPQDIFESARPNNSLNLPNNGACTASNDITSCNATLNTYQVSGDYKMLNDLGKLRYYFTPSTTLTVTAYAGNTYEDSTGNGDNDNLPYATRLAYIQNQITPNCTPSGGSGVTGYTVITNSNPNACYSAQQWAAVSYGPDGGGQGRNRGTTLQDFSATFATVVGDNSIALNAYSDYYNFHKFSCEAAGLDPTGTYYVGTGTYTDEYLTHGFLATDDIAGRFNDVGFGYMDEHQQTSGNTLSTSGAPNWIMSFVSDPILGEGADSFFVRDSYTPTSKVEGFLNAWYSHSTVTNDTTFDPRLSVVFKPTSRDVVRLTGGEADGDPSVSIANSVVISGIDNPSSLNPTCDSSLLNTIASSGNSNLTSEHSKDVELGYGHSFWGDTAVNIVAYDSIVYNQLFAGTIPLTAQAVANPAISGQLAGFAGKINSACGTSYTGATVISRLGLSSYFNAASAMYRGIQLTGRIRGTRQVAVDFEYDVQSSQQFGEPYDVLLGNPYLLNGGQIEGIPLQKASLTFDYANPLGGFESQLEAYYTGNNNTWNRPAFTYFNGFISKQVTKNVLATISVYNVFDNAAQIYGYFGEQLAHQTNQYYTGPTSAVGQAINIGYQTQNELFGIQPRSVMLTLSTRI